MKVLIFGSSGMVGRGVLLEALDSPDVAAVVSVGRRPVDVSHPKLTQIEHDNFEDFSSIGAEFEGVDACLWCLGTSSAGMDEASYTRITHTFTMAAAKLLLERSPEARFCFVSGAGTSSGSGQMWARVKAKTEDDLAALGFGEVVSFRPAMIRPMRGSAVRGAGLRVLYAVLFPLMPLLRLAGGATTTVEIGRAMVRAAQGKAPKKVLETRDINALAAAG